MMRRAAALAVMALAAAMGGLIVAQDAGGAKKGAVQRVKVHGKALEGNLEGDSPDREVLVYLPASYRTSGNRRYPVVYFLHGFTDDPDHWWGFIKYFVNLPEIFDRVFADGSTREVIVAMPNAFTAYQGAMYSNSATTGNWEDFVTDQLVAYIDGHYRTIAAVESRGLAGHSMGGYGALKIGMKHPEVYSSLYVMSACCLSAPTAQSAGRGGARAEAIHSQADAAKADFGTKAVLAEAAAFSPNPKNPPLYFDLPTKDGEFRPEIAAKWAANAPLAMIDQYISYLRRMKAVAMDVGLQDGLGRDVKVLDGILSDYQVPHTYETYEGDHINHVAVRIEKNVMPFFSRNLVFERARR
jgi:enterochelin esterase-like enzyme